MGDDMDAMMADGLLRTVRDVAKLLYGENQTYPCDDVKRMMADVERLRAALRGAEGQMAMGNMNGGWRIIRAALEEGRT